MKRVLFIYNRHAGKNKTWSGLSDILNAMTERDCLVTAYPTQYRGDAGEAIVRWSADYDQVVVAGGDGTLSEAISGAIRLPNPPVIGYIPVGTTNDFSKNLELPAASWPTWPPPPSPACPTPMTWGASTGAASCMWRLLGRLRRSPTPPPKRSKTCWATTPMCWRW